MSGLGQEALAVHKLFTDAVTLTQEPPPPPDRSGSEQILATRAGNSSALRGAPARSPQ